MHTLTRSDTMDATSQDKLARALEQSSRLQSWYNRTPKEIAQDHAEADARTKGVCGCSACCIVRYGMTSAQHSAYRLTGKWPAGVAKPEAR